jgi:hypothetical protein
MQDNGDLLIGLSALIWLLSLALLFGGLVLVCIKSVRRIGLFLLAGSVGVWVLSMGMCAVGMPEEKPTTEKRDARALPPGTLPASRPPAAPLERERPPAGAWRRGDMLDPTYALDSSNAVDGWLTSKQPTLVVRCHEGKTEVYVATDLNVSTEYGKRNLHTVRLGFDAQPPMQELWSESTDDKALFAPDGVAIARRLGTAQKLTFEFTPFNAKPGAASFNLTGSDGVVASVAKACGWTP